MKMYTGMEMRPERLLLQQPLGLGRIYFGFEKANNAIHQCRRFAGTNTIHHHQENKERPDCGVYDGHEQNQGKLLEKSAAGTEHMIDGAQMSHDDETNVIEQNHPGSGIRT